MIKTPVRDGTVLVTFELPAAVEAKSVSLCGDFNDWSETSHPLTRTEDKFTARVELAAGQRWRFRYLLDGARWENDWAADDYITNDFGGEDSVVDLTDITLPAAPEAPPTEADKPAGARRRKAAAGTEKAAAATEEKAAPTSTRSRRATAADGATKPSAASAAAEEKPKKAKAASASAGASAGAEGTAKKPAASSRRKTATSRQGSGKES